jgi:hypothetical protein
LATLEGLTTTCQLKAEDSAMRKLLVLAAFAALAACHRQSDTDMGQASPNTGRTTTDTSMTTTPSSGQTGRTTSDSIGNRGDSAMIHRSVPDSARSDSAWTKPSGQTSQPSGAVTTHDSIGTRGDSALINRSVPDSGSSKPARRDSL